MRVPSGVVGIGGEDGSVDEREEFNRFIGDLGVKDIPMVGRKFTWYRPNERAKSMIDRVMVTSEWFSLWQGCTQYVLEINISGHCPLLLKNTNIDLRPKPLRSLIVGFWIKVLLNLWKRLRRKVVFPRVGAYVLKEKLMEIKKSLKIWNVTTFGNLQILQ